jgi:hypothetical protein
VVKGNARSDTSFVAPPVAVQAEHKFRKTAKAALLQALKYLAIFLDHFDNGCVNRVLFLGINFDSGPGAVQIEHFLYKVR